MEGVGKVSIDLLLGDLQQNSNTHYINALQNIFKEIKEKMNQQQNNFFI